MKKSLKSLLAVVLILGGCTSSMNQEPKVLGQEQALESEKFFVTYEQLHAAMAVMNDKLPKTKWKGIIAISRGGFFPALYIAHRLNIKNIEVLSVTSYGNDKKQGQLKLLQPFDFKSKNHGEGWLLIDELSDSGATLTWIRKHLPKAHYAVIYAKPQGMKVVDTYGASMAQETWIEFPWEL